MKVLHVVPALAPCYGGPSEAALQMCRALRGLSVDALLLTTDAAGSTRLPVATGRWVDFEGVPTWFFPRFAGEALKFAPGLRRWLNEQISSFDVVHVHSVFSYAPVVAGEVCRRSETPYVVRPLGTLSPYGRRRKRRRKQLFLRLFGRRLLARAAAIHCTSELERSQIERDFGSSNCVVVPLGVEPPTNREPHTAGATNRAAFPYVLFLGRLHTIKNLEALLAAFASARPLLRGKACRLWIAGRGPEELHLRKLVRELGLEETVSFLGWLEGRRKAEILAGASLLVLPSFAESFGIAAAEAMAHGVPVLVSEHVALAPTIAAASAGWVVGTDRRSLGVGLQMAFRDPGELDRRGHAARELACRSLSWQAAACRLKELYGRISA